MDVSSIPRVSNQHTAAPLWRLERDIEQIPRAIDADMTCDTVVVGAGITGLAVAENLSRHSENNAHSVVVLDAGRIGQGSSGWNAGILTVDTTIDLSEIEEQYGEDQARKLVSDLSNILTRTKQNLNLGDNWQSGRTLYVASKPGHVQHLRDELDSRRKYNLPAELLEQRSISQVYPGFAGALALGNEHGVHPVALLLALAKLIAERGGVVFEDSPVTGWEHVGDKFVVSCRSQTSGAKSFKITAKNLVICTGVGTSAFSELEDISRLVVPVVGHVFVTEPSAEFAALTRESGTVALWDSLELYHYVRYLPDGRVLVGGEETAGVLKGEVLKGSDEPRIRKLYEWAQKHHTITLPPIQHCWRASLVVPSDGLPLVKFRRLGENTIISAYTDGLPFGMLLGSMISQAVLEGTTLPEMLTSERRPSLETRLLSLFPGGNHPLAFARTLAFKAAFAAMRLRDRLF